MMVTTNQNTRDLVKDGPTCLLQANLSDTRKIIILTQCISMTGAVQVTSMALFISSLFLNQKQNHQNAILSHHFKTNINYILHCVHTKMHKCRHVNSYMTARRKYTTEYDKPAQKDSQCFNADFLKYSNLSHEVHIQQSLT